MFTSYFLQNYIESLTQASYKQIILLPPVLFSELHGHVGKCKVIKWAQ